MNWGMWNSMFIQSLMVCRCCTSLHRLLELCSFFFCFFFMQNKDVKFGKRQSTPEVHLEEGGGETIMWCATHSPLYIRSDTHGGTCIYMHVWCPAQGHSITACPAPRCACSPVLSGETSLGGGQQQSDSGSTAGGVFWGVGGGWRGQRITHKSLGLAHPRLRAAWLSRGGQIIPPCWVLPQI